MNESICAAVTSARFTVVQGKEKKVMGRKVPEAVRLEAIRRVIECHERVVDVAEDMGLSTSAIHNWRREHMKALEDQSENERLKERGRELESLLNQEREEKLKILKDLEYERRSKSEILQELIRNR